MLTVINPDGRYSGVQYDEPLRKHQLHHASMGQATVWLTDPLPAPDESGVYPLHPGWDADWHAAEVAAPMAHKVTRYQALVALETAGLLSTIETHIAGAGDALLTLAWQEAGFDRHSPLIATVAAALAMTDGQVDDLFRAAGAVE